jgi:choice-of-anchor B domain-containing protein
MKRSFPGRHAQGAAMAFITGLALSTGALAHSEHKTLYVSETGSDQSDCRTTEQPCRSIEYALANALKGDTIKVAAGRYTFRPDEPEEGIQLVGWFVTIKGGYDAARDFAEPAGDGEPTIVTGPAPKFRARLEERNLILPKTEGVAQAAVQVAQAQPEPEPPAPAGDVLFVSESGVDRGECTDPAAPCATLIYALSVAASGDRIAVAEGAFLLSQDTFEGARGRNITIEGGYSTENQFRARALAAATQSFVIGASPEERERLSEQGLILVQDTKAFDILAAPAVDTAAGTAAAECINGSADGYPCKGLDLLARIPLSAFSSNPSGANDIWGFVDKNDNREYAIIGLRNGTAVVDVTDPLNPVEVGTIPGLQTIWRDIKVYQFFDSAANRWKAYAYVTADAVNQGLQIIDLTGLPGTISLAATVNAFASAHNIYMANIDYATGVPLPGQKAYAYILGSNLQNGAFRIFDLTNPTAPTLVTTPPAGTGYVHDATSMLITDNRASQCQPGHNPCELLIDYNETTVDFWDVTDKAAPSKLSSITYPNAEYTHSGWWSKDKRYVFVQDELDEQRHGFNTRVIALDLADLTNPIVAGSWSGPTQAIDHNGFTLGDEYYMSNYRRGLTVLDIANPPGPSEKYFFDTFLLPAENDAVFNGAWGTYPYLPSGTILVSDIEGGLFLLKKSSTAPEPQPSPNGTTAFAWAHQPTASSYSPHPTYAYNPKGPITVTRSGVGVYTVRFSGFGGNGKAGGHVQVTGYGPQPNACKVVGWSSSTADFIAKVMCINPAGSPIDERFSILVEWPR